MPGMSPRIKAKKGRFGADGLPPTIKITTHVNGDTETLGAAFTMTAVATDPENGNVSAAITWAAGSVPATGIVQFTDGTGGTQVVNITGATGNYDITATIVDGGFTVTDTVRLTAVV